MVLCNCARVECTLRLRPHPLEPAAPSRKVIAVKPQQDDDGEMEREALLDPSLRPPTKRPRLTATTHTGSSGLDPEDADLRDTPTMITCADGRREAWCSLRTPSPAPPAATTLAAANGHRAAARAIAQPTQSPAAMSLSQCTVVAIAAAITRA